MPTMNVETYENGILVEQSTVVIPDPDPVEVAAVNRWRSMGFEDAEIVAMYPHFSYAVQHSSVTD
jgi:hypothetical protein